jgi:hypothetical protein
MTPIQIQLAQSRIRDLRIRVSGISKVLRAAMVATRSPDEATPTTLQSVIMDLQAVSADFESICDEQLNDLTVKSGLNAAVARAESEVNSGEFDSQS